MQDKVMNCKHFSHLKEKILVRLFFIETLLAQYDFLGEKTTRTFC